MKAFLIEESVKKLEVVGKPVNRVDALDKVTGAAKYTADLYFPGMLYGKTLRSRYPHALIRGIKIGEAEKLPGVAVVLTAKDIPGEKRFGVVIKDQEVLVSSKARYLGDGLALVAAVTEEIAEEALKLIKIEYKPLPVVSSPLEALKEESPKIHEHGNLIKSYRVRKGDVNKGFSESDVVIERVYTTQFVDHAYMEPESAVAVPSHKGVVVYGSMQHPYSTRRVVASTLGLPLSKVRVIQTNLGGGFGGKDETASIICARAALLAVKANRPVKMVNTRSESMLESYKRHPYIMRYRVGVSEKGEIKAMEINLLADGGAYASTSPFVLWRSTVQATGPYEVPNVEISSKVVYTNNPYCGAMRGFGSPQVNFAVESIMDELAEEIGMDPIELRLKNAFKNGSETATGQVLNGHVVSIRQILRKARETSNWEGKRKLYKVQKGRLRRGIGIACCYRGVSLGAEGKDFAAAYVNVTEDGGVIVACGIAENGQGAKTVLSQIAAEALGVPVDYITFLGSDTSIVRDSGPTVASRGTIMGGGAVKEAAVKVRMKMAEVAAVILKTQPEKIIFKGGMVYDKENPEKHISFKELARRCYKKTINLSSIGWFRAPEIYWDEETGMGTAYFTWVYSANVAEVEVNLETGKVKVLRVYAFHDPGKVVNPKTAKSQVYGGVAMGIGYALLEDYKLEECIPKTLNLRSYRLIRAYEMPEVIPVFIENPDPVAPFGAKSLGEPATEVVAPAIVNAIYQATGVRIRSLPVTRDKILKGLKER